MSAWSSDCCRCDLKRLASTSGRKPICELTISSSRREFSPDEVWALVGAATSAEDAAIFLTAAFAGLCQDRLLALVWREVDFENRVLRSYFAYQAGSGLNTQRCEHGVSVPMTVDIENSLMHVRPRREECDKDD